LVTSTLAFPQSFDSLGAGRPAALARPLTMMGTAVSSLSGAAQIQKQPPQARPLPLPLLLLLPRRSAIGAPPMTQLGGCDEVPSRPSMTHSVPLPAKPALGPPPGIFHLGVQQRSDGLFRPPPGLELEGGGGVVAGSSRGGSLHPALARKLDQNFRRQGTDTTAATQDRDGESSCRSSVASEDCLSFGACGCSAEAEASPEAVCTLRLAGPAVDGRLGARSLPSVGSAGHHAGLCKPCDFIHRSTCRAGMNCKFCHLCGPDENKHRKKQKQGLARAMKHFDQEVALARMTLAATIQEHQQKQQLQRRR